MVGLRVTGERQRLLLLLLRRLIIVVEMIVFFIDLLLLLPFEDNEEEFKEEEGEENEAEKDFDIDRAADDLNLRTLLLPLLLLVIKGDGFLFVADIEA